MPDESDFLQSRVVSDGRHEIAEVQCFPIDRFVRLNYSSVTSDKE